MSDLKTRLADDTKAAMRAGDKTRLGTLRLVSSAIKQREVDERIVLDDAAVTAILEKAIKQRRESQQQFEAGGRPELAAQEAAEIVVLSHYLPPPLAEAELSALIEQAIAEVGAQSLKELGKVMAWLKPRIAGRADPAAASARAKARLS
jgi:uncharacterized protein YqeY